MHIFFFSKMHLLIKLSKLSVSMSRSFFLKSKYLLKLSWWNNRCFSPYRENSSCFWFVSMVGRNWNEDMQKSRQFCSVAIFKNNLPKIYKIEERKKFNSIKCSNAIKLYSYWTIIKNWMNEFGKNWRKTSLCLTQNK